MNGSRRLVWLGSIVLAGTAALHASGYSEVTAAVAKSNIEGILSGAIGGLWLFPSIHWLFLAILAVVAVTFPPRATTYLLCLIVAVLVADIVLLLLHVGPFLGEVLLGIAAVAYGVGAWFRAKPDPTQPRLEESIAQGHELEDAE